MFQSLISLKVGEVVYALYTYLAPKLNRINKGQEKYEEQLPTHVTKQVFNFIFPLCISDGLSVLSTIRRVCGRSKLFDTVACLESILNHCRMFRENKFLPSGMLYQRKRRFSVQQTFNKKSYTVNIYFVQKYYMPTKNDEEFIKGQY